MLNVGELTVALQLLQNRKMWKMLQVSALNIILKREYESGKQFISNILFSNSVNFD